MAMIQDHAVGSDSPNSPGDAVAVDAVDPLFKGCTRPPMALGVPIAPLVLVCMPLILMGGWFSMFIWGLVPIAVLIMRGIAKEDDQQFRMLGLKFRLRVMHRNRNGRFWRCSTYSPFSFKRTQR